MTTKGTETSTSSATSQETRQDVFITQILDKSPDTGATQGTRPAHGELGVQVGKDGGRRTLMAATIAKGSPKAGVSSAILEILGVSTALELAS